MKLESLKFNLTHFWGGYKKVVLGVIALAVMIYLFTVPMFSGYSAMVMIPMFGTAGCLALIGFGIYHAVAYHHYLYYSDVERPSSYKRDLRDLRKKRMRAIRDVYSNKNYSNHSDYIRRVKNIDAQIARHKGEAD